MKATLTNGGFYLNGKSIQGTYTFSDISLTSSSEHQDVYSAIMKTPVTIPCTVVINKGLITIAGIDNNTIRITY